MVPRASRTMKNSVFCIWSSPCLRGKLLPFSSVKYWIYPSNLKSIHHDIQDNIFQHSLRELAQRVLWNNQNKPYYPFFTCKLNISVSSEAFDFIPFSVHFSYSSTSIRYFVSWPGCILSKLWLKFNGLLPVWSTEVLRLDSRKIELQD
jgi:hypothetical protein